MSAAQPVVSNSEACGVVWGEFVCVALAGHNGGHRLEGQGFDE